MWAAAFGIPVLRRMEATFADHRTVLLEGANHYWQDDAPEAACRAIRDWFADSAGDREPV
ncbi:hypothetical protein DVS28_a2890 [Euzebya pacifica]|uniref:Alpha/beta hydrolase n=1 Tax=Euzebya pacifica TaxID=1608957 RepID=A0A346XZC2_9ACTN|nr:hypothetical protein DVS28_a2890 [Euzebya pacifica]